ncbi:5-bromo-4-chloroindolyl phosphate hydrolysis family protein [uncultured Clostridium sp.]|uniref:5-bromo-4-chloroindolyl phosphate hydrolysis family protein n=1 Tax=uncultured Clostridium sp. TaxID=59620 RepID=UPI0025FE5151|nr:5-bromo-4-chloroindolyl phosphate hydrolysis family protein [uncultured Clostridium sp.]
MSQKDFFDIEGQIQNAIDNAFKYINYANKKVNDVTDDTFNNLDKKFEGLSKKWEEKLNKGIDKLSRKEIKEKYKYISRKPYGKFKGKIYTIIGFAGCIISFIGFAFCSVLSMFDLLIVKAGVYSSFIALAILFVFSLYLAVKGTNIRRRNERFNKYSQFLLDKNYCEINTLAESVSKKSKFVIKDLENMMNFEMFKDGHISDDKSYFILGNELYEEYLNSKKSYLDRAKNEEDKYTYETSKDDYSIEKDESLSFMEYGAKYISEINKINYSLHGNSICKDLSELEELTRNIMNNVKNNPQKLPLVKKFFNHYLPISLKLINSYKELDEQTIEVENIKRAKKEIENSLSLINTAFKRLLDDLFEDVVMDVSSDISVLETLFSQEGLTEDDFNKKN